MKTYDASCGPEEPTFFQCSWQTVLKTLEEAKENYLSRNHYRSYAILGMELAFQLTDALPNECGIGAIKAILGIAFEVIFHQSPAWNLAYHVPVQTAKRRGENRMRILEAFETIPGTILTVNLSYISLNPTADDEKLRQDFHRELVKRMPVLMDILLGKEPCTDFISLSYSKSSVLD